MKHNAKILIAEDEILLQLTLAIMLKRMGFSDIKKTTTGAGAITLALSESFDFILMDIMLKDHVDGIDAYRQIKEKCGPVPVIYITGNADPKSKSRASQFGYHDFLSKPLSFEQLQKSISDLFSEG